MDKSHNDQPTLKVLVTGGGPVGLSFALLLQDLFAKENKEREKKERPELKVSLKVYDHRWMREATGGKPKITWKGESEGNNRRQQVVTIQSQQYLKFTKEIQTALFTEGNYSEMWPRPSKNDECYPRNVRISHLENTLLEIANKKEEVELIPRKFAAKDSLDEIKTHHLLVIAEGADSETVESFLEKFGEPDKTMYSLGNEKPLKDFVLGLRVKSAPSGLIPVVLTIAQNRFLLNSLGGEGFLNMRLTDEEAEEVKGVGENESMKTCIQSQPCLMERSESSTTFRCPTHGSVFSPAYKDDSKLMTRIYEGLKLFGIEQDDLTAVTAWSLSMVQRPRFTAQLCPPLRRKDRNTPGTFGALLGDAANAIHFWPGRGLNTGLVSAISLARCLYSLWGERGRRSFRDSDFLHHEAIMARLQYRNKSRAWRAMVTPDSEGELQSIKSKIEYGIGSKVTDGDSLDSLSERVKQITHIQKLEEEKKRAEHGNENAVVLEEAAQRNEDDSKLRKQAKSSREEANRTKETFENYKSAFSTNLSILEKEVYLELLLGRLRESEDIVKDRVEKEDSPKEDHYKNRLNLLNIETLRTLYFCNPWDTSAMGGEEVDIDLLPDQKTLEKERKTLKEEREQLALEQQNREQVEGQLAEERKTLKEEREQLALEQQNREQVEGQLAEERKTLKEEREQLALEQQRKYWWGIAGIIIGGTGVWWFN